jgi:hypothetical protein
MDFAQGRLGCAEGAGKKLCRKGFTKNAKPLTAENAEVSQRAREKAESQRTPFDLAQGGLGIATDLKLDRKGFARDAKL